MENKLASYMDDIVLYLEQLANSLHKLMKTFKYIWSIICIQEEQRKNKMSLIELQPYQQKKQTKTNIH